MNLYIISYFLLLILVVIGLAIAVKIILKLLKAGWVKDMEAVRNRRWTYLSILSWYIGGSTLILSQDLVFQSSESVNVQRAVILAFVLVYLVCAYFVYRKLLIALWVVIFFNILNLIGSAMLFKYDINLFQGYNLYVALVIIAYYLRSIFHELSYRRQKLAAAQQTVV